MAHDIRKPQITSPTPEGQLMQVKSYLIQLVEQLNFALRTLESSAGNGGTEGGTSPNSTAAIFSEIKGLIMKSSDIINAYFEQMEPMICESEMVLDLIKANGSGGGIDSEQLNAAVEEALQNAKDSGEFDGADGVSATHVWNGTTLTVTSASGTSSADLKGDKGDKGDTGDQGPQGEKGEKGDTGEQGAKGDKGDKGDTGEQGPEGPQGPQGIKGEDGADGEQGPKGEKGDPGADGAQGPKGDTGDTGPQGPQGEKGDKGDKGDTGAQGEKGADGAKGSDGVSCSHSWSGTTLTVTSASGTSSANLKGDKGDKGDTGAQGIQGIQGEKGDTGATGADGAKGADGYTPVKGTDYYTEADKNEMVSLVLAALPTWSGGSY